MMTQAATFEQVTDAVVDIFMAPMNDQLGSERLTNVLGTMGWTVDQYENVVRDNGANSTSHRGGW